MNCEWEPYNNKFRCKYCGFIVPNSNFNKNCMRETKDIPSLNKRMVNLSRAVGQHVLTGSKHCSEEDREERFNICKSNKCGLFRENEGGGVCAHDSCGCYLRSHGKFMDKLSWADSRCPVGMWGPKIDEK